MTENWTKIPRLYVECALGEAQQVNLDKDRAHYLKNVLRLKQGDTIRLFNGRDGDWLYCLDHIDKKTGDARPVRQIQPQTHQARRVHLVFAPIKKARLDFLIEKAVELGATDLYPVLTDFTQVRDLNGERVRKQIIEAAEQCERQDIPNLHPLQDLTAVLANWPEGISLMICVERSDAPLISEQDLSGETGVLIGPEGGLSEAEIALARNFKSVSLGPSVLRSETAGIYALSCIMTQS